MTYVPAKAVETQIEVTRMNHGRYLRYLLLFLAKTTAVVAFAAVPSFGQDEPRISIDLTGSVPVRASSVSASAFHIKYAATDAVRSARIEHRQGVAKALGSAKPRVEAVGAIVPSVPSRRNVSKRAWMSSGAAQSEWGVG
ncbi:MAG: hypothetical protein DMG30_23455 [Acidobacteria bacterium]|nr:MAG: hypothetical protein DMG30_23455 [Acidobacteriota bacterium]